MRPRRLKKTTSTMTFFRPLNSMFAIIISNMGLCTTQLSSFGFPHIKAAGVVVVRSIYRELHITFKFSSILALDSYPLVLFPPT